MPQLPIDRDTRLARLAQSHGLNTSSDLAQVFRVTNSTAGRWKDQARSRPLEEVMPGPAMILLELYEQGVETRDLQDVREAAKVRNGPDNLFLQPDEECWSISSTEGRKAVTITLPNGRTIDAFPRWIKTRIRHLEDLLPHMPDLEAARCRKAVERYKGLLSSKPET